MSDSIWHEPTERPQDGDCIVSSDGLVGEYEYDNGQECIFCPNGHIEFIRHWKAYAHIDDLIAQADKAERLQKAVDYALQVLDNLTEIGGIDLEIIKIKQLIKVE